MLLAPTAWLLLSIAQGSADGPAPPRASFAAPSEAELAGHRAMLERLVEVRKDTKRNNAYLGDFQLEKLERSRAQLAEKPGTSPKTLAKLDHEFGTHYLRLGRNDEALAAFRASRDRIIALPRDEWPPFAERLTYDLGVAAMRKGETDNCVALHTAQSCLLPIEAGGRHADEAGSREAMRWFRETLATTKDPDVALCARWLLNIAAMTVGEFPDGLSDAERLDPALFRSKDAFPRFDDVAPELGLNEHDLSGGAILEDFDGDGLLDVFTSSWDTATSLHYRRNVGDGTFEDLSRAAGLEGLYGGLNLLQADFDDDGWTDVLVLRGAWLFGERGRIPKSLVQNRGGRAFLDVTIRAGIDEPTYPSQGAGFADYDLDGDLDLYVGAEANAANLFPGQLWRNAGDGTFADVAAAAGVENVRFCKGVSWGDYDADGDPDLYASNLGGKNRLYRNAGDGTFADVAEEAGVTGPYDGFPCWFWDFDGDGALDLYASAYHLVDPSQDLRVAPLVRSWLGTYEGELGALYKGDGKGRFTDVARAQGLLRLTMAMGSNFGDVDNDGFLDFYLGTGYPAYDGLVPNVLYWNRGGERFADVTEAAGVGHLQKGHGVALGDLDRDGDLDLFEQMGGAYPGDGFGDVLFRNPGTQNRWVSFVLVGTTSNRSAIGTRLRGTVEAPAGSPGTTGAPRVLLREVSSGGSFGCNPLEQHLGLGGASELRRLEVTWPASRTTQVFEHVAAGKRYEIVEGAAELRELPLRPFALGAAR